MAVLSGTAGAVKIATDTVAELDSWDLDFGSELLPSESFGDTWEEKSKGLGAWSAKASGRFDKTDTAGHVALNTAALNGTTVALRLYVDGSKYYSGSAYVKMAPKASVDGLVEVSYDFTGTGALSYT